MVMNPLAAYVYSNSSVLMDTYQPVGTILVSSVLHYRETNEMNRLELESLKRQENACE